MGSNGSRWDLMGQNESIILMVQNRSNWINLVIVGNNGSNSQIKEKNIKIILMVPNGLN